ncbi:leucine Rich Repeat family protein [Aphelenchoides avenae]|nr:leucine Rich Repeat family protein [Aphelenchus avenae]
MDLSNSNLVKDLECPICHDIFDEPKLLVCGHTVCQECVDKIVATRHSGANAGQGQDQNRLKCPLCDRETEIPPDGLRTNYSLVALVHRAQKTLVDACACNGCGKQAPVADMFTCETCQTALNFKPIWICSLCAMNQHRDHRTSECSKATRQQIEEACQGIADSVSLADMHVGLTMSHLSGALGNTEAISQLLNEQKLVFSRLEALVESADYYFTQEDLAASLQESTELSQKFEQASAFAKEASKSLESVLLDFHKKLEGLFPKERDEESLDTEGCETSDEEEPIQTEDSETVRVIYDVSKFDDGQQVIKLTQRRIRVIPDLSRFTQLQSLGFCNNFLKSIKGKIIHTTLTELDLFGNSITKIRGLDGLVNLEWLSVGYNNLRKIEGLTNLVKLKRIHLLHNNIEKIEGLETLVNLELLDLRDNRIKEIENLDNQTNLSALYLGNNKIDRIENISRLSKLRLLSIEGNRISKLENLDALVDLEQLYVAKQEIETFDGIQNLNKLKLIDGAKNFIASLDHLDHLQQLEDLWLNNNIISQWTEVDKLAPLANLRSVYLESNPIQIRDRENYRHKVIQALPQVIQVDDTLCR